MVKNVLKGAPEPNLRAQARPKGLAAKSRFEILKQMKVEGAGRMIQIVPA